MQRRTTEVIVVGMSTSKSKHCASRVCLLAVDGELSFERLQASIDNVLNFRAYRLLRIFAHEEVVGVKPCQNRAEHSLDYVAAVVNMLGTRGVTPMVCDTTERYRDVKQNAVKRIEELAAHFTDPSLPIVILDGIKGDHEVVVRANGDSPEVCLAGELPALGGAVVVSCVEADPLAGMSAALVNLGIGFASKRGKIKHYAMDLPRVQQEKCYSCRSCLRKCPVGAIEMGDSHVVINAMRCINCGRCTEVARFGGIIYTWDATPEHFRTVVTAHARAAFNVLSHRVVCINVLDLPAKATGQPRKSILFSRDPVAIDAAALDLLSEHNLLEEDQQPLASHILNAAKAAGIGRTEYFVERVAF